MRDRSDLVLAAFIVSHTLAWRRETEREGKRDRGRGREPKGRRNKFVGSMAK
jgi:hypothetical protein